MSKRFVIDGDNIKDLQSDWLCKVVDVDDRYYFCEKLNDMDDEKWEYRKKYNTLKTKIHKIFLLCSDQK